MCTGGGDAPGGDSSDEEGAGAPPKAPSKAPASKAPAKPPKPPLVKPHHKRATWEARFKSKQNEVYSDEPAYKDPLNDSKPLTGTSADVGRFVLMGTDAYPNLKKADRQGAVHLGWSVKIVKFEAGKLWAQEKGESATGFAIAEIMAMVLLSV